MKLNQLKMKANEKGFTLIELMIVIAIIGILAAVAIPNFIAYRDKAFCSSASADANSISAKFADYFANPMHTSLFTVATGGSITTAGVSTGLNSLVFGQLSGSNTASVLGTINNIKIKVTDGSERCPLEYQKSNPNEWSQTKPGVYTKNMK